MNRRDNVWRSEGCFLAYANVNNSSAHEDGFHDVVFTNEDPGEGPHSFDRPRLFALVQSVPRHREVLGALVVMTAASLARDTTNKNTVRMFPNVTRSRPRCS
jgi:hypothetical protein